MWIGKVSKGAVDRLAFNPDGRTLFTRDTTVVRAWDVVSQDSTVLMTDADGYPTIGDLIPTDNALYVVHANSIRVIPLPAGKTTTHPLPAAVVSACLIDDGRTLLTADTGTMLRAWALPTFAPLDPPPAFPPDSYVFSRITATRDGSRVAGAIRDGREYPVVVWDVPANKPVVVAVRPVAIALAYPVVSPDTTAVACGEATHLVVLDLPSGDVRFDVRLGRMDVVHVAWHPAGKVIAAAGNTSIVYLIDAQTGTTLAQYDWKIGKIRSLAFGPDGATCAAGGTSKKFAVWDVDF